MGVGLELLGVEEFMQKKFLAGDIFVDEKKQCYEDLGFKRYANNSSIILQYNFTK